MYPINWVPTKHPAGLFRVGTQFIVYIGALAPRGVMPCGISVYGYDHRGSETQSCKTSLLPYFIVPLLNRFLCVFVALWFAAPFNHPKVFSCGFDGNYGILHPCAWPKGVRAHEKGKFIPMPDAAKTGIRPGWLGFDSRGGIKPLNGLPLLGNGLDYASPLKS